MPFTEDAKDFLNKSVEATKTAISKAGAAVHEFGDKSVVVIEIKQLEAKKTKAINKLGLLCYNTLKQDKAATSKQKDIADVVASLEDFDMEIQKRQDILAKMKEQSQKAKQQEEAMKKAKKQATDAQTQEQDENQDKKEDK